MLGKIKLREQEQRVVCPGAGAILDHDAIETGRDSLCVGRHLGGRKQRLRVCGIPRGQGREQPAHDGSAGVHLAGLCEMERLDEASVGLGGQTA